MCVQGLAFDARRGAKVSAAGAEAQLRGARGQSVIARYALAIAAWRVFAEPDRPQSYAQHGPLDRLTFLRLGAKLLQHGILRSGHGAP